MRILGTPLLRCALVLGAVPVTAAQAGPLWQHDFSPKLQWYEVTDVGNVVAATQKSVIALDPESGSVVWERTDLDKVDDESVTFIPDTPFAMVLKAGGGLKGTGTLHLLNVATGEDVWTRQGGKVMWSQARLDQKDLLYLSKEGDEGWTMQRVDLLTGDEIFSKGNYFDHKQPMLQMFKAYPDKKLSMKMTLDGNQAPIFVDGGKAYIELWHKDQGIVKRDAESGEVLWNDKLKWPNTFVPTPGAGHPPLQVMDGAVYVTDGKRAVYGLQIADGKPLWDPKKGPKMKGDINLFATYEGRLVVSGVTGKDKNFVTVRDAKTGGEAWKKPVKMKGALGLMSPTEHGLLLGDAEVGKKTTLDMLDPATGNSKWNTARPVPGDIKDVEVEAGHVFVTSYNGKKTFFAKFALDSGAAAWGYNVKGEATDSAVKDGVLFFADAKGKVTALDASTGQAKWETPVPIEGKKSEETLQTVLWNDEGKVVVTYSSQNVVGLNPKDGSVAFHTYYKAPGPTGFQVAAGVALMAASAASAAAEAQQSFNAGYASGAGAYTASQKYASNAESFGDMKDAFGDAATAVMRRARASKATDNYYYILTRVDDGEDKGVGLVRVRLSDGAERGKVVLNDRNPDYELDEIGGYLYLLQNDKVLKGFTFGGGVDDEVDAPVAETVEPTPVAAKPAPPPPAAPAAEEPAAEEPATEEPAADGAAE